MKWPVGVLHREILPPTHQDYFLYLVYMEPSKYVLNKLRLTFFEELTDVDMYEQCETLLELLKIPYKGTAIVSPVEDHDNENRHIHVHWVGEALVKRTKENVMSEFRKNGGKIYPGNKGSNYESFITTDVAAACATLRYPLKTGLNDRFFLKQEYLPDWFCLEEQ